MTARAALALIGRTAVYHTSNGLHVEVAILDVRTVFNRTDFQIRPLAGDGTTWVSADTCRVQLEASIVCRTVQ